MENLDDESLELCKQSGVSNIEIQEIENTFKGVVIHAKVSQMNGMEKEFV
jgi:hypothetical protein